MKRWCLWCKAYWHLPLVWYKGWSPVGLVAFPRMMMSAGMISSSHSGLFPPRFPWAGARVANPQEDWNRMFWAQEGGVAPLLCMRDMKEEGAWLNHLPCPLQMMDLFPHKLRSPDKYGPLILYEKLWPEAHYFPLSKRWWGNHNLLEIFKTLLPYDVLSF